VDAYGLTDPEFRRQLAALQVQAHAGSAQLAEVASTARRIRDGDPESWVLEWLWTAGTAWAEANVVAPTADDSHTGERHLQAATYYGAALSQMARSEERGRLAAVWHRHHNCWERAVDRLEMPGERLEISYDAASLPAYFFAAPAGGGRRRPLVIMHNGAYGPTSAMRALGGAAAAARGYHWMTFDGPGQQAALHQRGLFFRPDWEAVLTPVLDAMVARADVDPARIAVIGAGQAGYWLPRALAHEHRLAAVALEPGVVDVATAWRDSLPEQLVAMLDGGDHLSFDRALRAALLFTPGAEAVLRERAAPYGLAAAPASLMFATVDKYRLGDEPASVQTPLLVMECGDRSPWPRQSGALSDRVSNSSLLDAEELSPDARESHLFGWLEPLLG
jgi:dienelactone hydrolase